MIAFISCNENTATNSTQPTESGVNFSVLSVVPDGEINYAVAQKDPNLSDDYKKQLDEDIKQVSILTVTKLQVVSNAETSWRDASEIVKTNLEKLKGNKFLYEFDNYSAVLMANKLTQTDDDWTDEKYVALEENVEKMIKYKSPESSVFQKAISKLESKWDANRINDYKKSAAKFANEYVEKQNCLDCVSALNDPSKLELLDHNQRKLTQILMSANTLSEQARK